MKISKRNKKILMFSALGLVVTLPLISVVSCSEVTRMSNTNQYYALSSSQNVSNTQLAQIALNEPVSGEDSSKFSSSLPSTIDSAVSWNFDKDGAITPNFGQDFTRYGNNSFINTKTNSSMNWLVQNNNTIVQQLFSSILSYVTGPITTYDYLGQNILQWSQSSSSALRMLGGDITQTQQALQPVVKSGLFQTLLGANNKYSIGSFAQDLVHPAYGPDKSTVYYLFPAYITYTVNNASWNKTPTWLSEQKDQNNYSSLLAAYMPAVANGSSADANNASVNNSSSINYNNQISVAEISNIHVIYEFYCSTSNYSKYLELNPVNATLNKDLTSKSYQNGQLKYPEINNQTLNYNPFYHKYFVLNLDSIYVSMQNIGLGLKSNNKAVKSDLQNYAALNYYQSTNTQDTTQQINYPEVYNPNDVKGDVNSTTSIKKLYTNLGNELNDHTDINNYWRTPAASWCFVNQLQATSNNDSVTPLNIDNLYSMQEGVWNQVNNFFNIASIGPHNALTTADIYIAIMYNPKNSISETPLLNVLTSSNLTAN